MATVSIKIAGRGYNLACDSGQEGHLRHLASMVDARVKAFTEQAGGKNINESLGLLLAAITLADELIENKPQIIMNPDVDNDDFTNALNELADRIEKVAELPEMG